MDNCKVCGSPMYDFECYDSEYNDTEHYEFVHARCPRCNKWYKWVEVFTFERIEGFEEDIQSSLTLCKLNIPLIIINHFLT